MVFDTILLVLVVYKTYLIQREETLDKSWTGARLVRLMFRDSVMYFAWCVERVHSVIRRLSLRVCLLPAPSDLIYSTSLSGYWGPTICSRLARRGLSRSL
jgi:hypothetical protein